MWVHRIKSALKLQVLHSNNVRSGRCCRKPKTSHYFNYGPQYRVSLLHVQASVLPELTLPLIPSTTLGCIQFLIKKFLFFCIILDRNFALSILCGGGFQNMRFCPFTSTPSLVEYTTIGRGVLPRVPIF